MEEIILKSHKDMVLLIKTFQLMMREIISRRRQCYCCNKNGYYFALEQIHNYVYLMNNHVVLSELTDPCMIIQNTVGRPPPRQ